MTSSSVERWAALQQLIASTACPGAEVRAECAEIVPLARQEISDTAAELERKLALVSPQAIRARWRFFADRPLLRQAGFGRLIWTCMAVATGTGDDRSTLADIAELCERWLHSQITLSSAMRLSDDGRRDLEIHTQEEIRRLFPFDTRLHWVTREIVGTALQEAGHADGAEWSAELLSNVAKMSASTHEFGHGCLATSDFDRFGILKHASFVAGSGKNHGFERLIMSRQPELQPFIQLSGAGGTTQFWPAHLRTASQGLELAVFEALGALGHDKGLVYESTVRELLRRWLPWKAEVLRGASVISGGGRNELETDVVVATGQTVNWLADAKCYAPAREPGASAFDPRYRKGAQQVHKRQEALKRGERLTLKGEPESPQFSGRHAEGALVTAHSCGASVWNRDLLAENEVPPTVAMIPLHQLVLVASLMRCKDDFMHYWRLRGDFIGTGAHLDDEHEVLLLSYLRRNAQKHRIEEA